jgi:Ca-activated chloride channel family protein
MTQTGDDDFANLRGLEVPPVAPEARRRALGASLMAFDAAQRAKQSAAALQGLSVWERVRSIVRSKGFRTMETRRLVPLGIATLALLILLPLGYQLYTSTVVSPGLTVASPKAVAPAMPKAEAPASSDRAAPWAPPQAAGAAQSAAIAPPPVPAPDGAVMSPARRLAGTAAAPAMSTGAAADATGMGSAAPMANAAVAAGKPMATYLPAARNGAFGDVAAPTDDRFASFSESPQKAVAIEPVSTFSIDVDTASYAYVRRALNEGRLPPPEAVRLEEMINSFPYDYPAPTSAEVPFKPTISVFPTPWNAATELLQIGIKGYAPPAAARRPANLVFLIDTSGSMDAPDKLPLLQRALSMLVNTLSADDMVSIVAYAGSAGVVLEPTRASDKTRILTALNNLSVGGATAGAEGIELAYKLAEQHKLAGNNRVILATDGDFNVGIADPGQLQAFIKQKRRDGIALSVLGFGEGNLDDAAMQALAQNGDGNASYIDSLSEAQKVLVKEAGSTLQTIAKDVKIQVEFNPAKVTSYRLIGYETRALNREDFNSDRVARDVGAGHTVTALYEITPAGGAAAQLVDPLRYGAAPATPAPNGKDGELADVKLRYKLPGSTASQLIEQPVTAAMVVDAVDKASVDARWAAAVAAFGQRLMGSDYAGSFGYGAIAQLAKGARGDDPDGYRAEFIRLVGLAGALSGDAGLTTPRPQTAPATANH